jgi:hypothetical protein
MVYERYMNGINTNESFINLLKIQTTNIKVENNRYINDFVKESILAWYYQ